MLEAAIRLLAMKAYSHSGWRNFTSEHMDARKKYAHCLYKITWLLKNRRKNTVRDEGLYLGIITEQAPRSRYEGGVAEIGMPGMGKGSFLSIARHLRPPHMDTPVPQTFALD